MSGCGNDFIALVEPASAPARSAIRAWCRRGISLGADGVFTLRRLRPQRGRDALLELGRRRGGALSQRHPLRGAARLPSRLVERSGDRAHRRGRARRAAARPAAPWRWRRRCPSRPRATTLVTDDGDFHRLARSSRRSPLRLLPRPAGRVGSARALVAAAAPSPRPRRRGRQRRLRRDARAPRPHHPQLRARHRRRDAGLRHRRAGHRRRGARRRPRRASDASAHARRLHARGAG